MGEQQQVGQSSSLTPYERDQCERLMARCARHLDGLDTTPDGVTQADLSAADRWPAWAAGTLYWACGEVLRGDKVARSEGNTCPWREAVVYAFRGCAQVNEYRGRAGGFLPAHLADGLTMLRNIVEGAIRRAV